MKPKKPLLHVLAWIAFIVFHFIILPKPEVFHDAPMVVNGELIMPSSVEIILVLLSLIGFYYFNILYLIPHLLARRHYWQYCVFVILIIGFVLLSVSLPIFFNVGSFVALPFGFYINTLLLFSLVFIASSMSNIVGRWFTSENHKKDIEHQKTLAVS